MKSTKLLLRSSCHRVENGIPKKDGPRRKKPWTLCAVPVGMWRNEPEAAAADPDSAPVKPTNQCPSASRRPGRAPPPPHPAFSLRVSAYTTSPARKKYPQFPTPAHNPNHISPPPPPSTSSPSLANPSPPPARSAQLEQPWRIRSTWPSTTSSRTTRRATPPPAGAAAAAADPPLAAAAAGPGRPGAPSRGLETGRLPTSRRRYERIERASGSASPGGGCGASDFAESGGRRWSERFLTWWRDRSRPPTRRGSTTCTPRSPPPVEAAAGGSRLSRRAPNSTSPTWTLASRTTTSRYMHHRIEECSAAASEH